jgi:predicted nucleotidyltransferase
VPKVLRSEAGHVWLRNHRALHDLRSDVDFFVEFADDVAIVLDAYFGLEEALEKLLGRPVDLVMPGALDNPYFAASPLRHSEELYAA